MEVLKINTPYVFKKCTKCDKWLVAYSGNFCKKNKNGNKYGLNSICKKCANLIKKKYRQDNKGKVSCDNKKFRENNKDYFKSYYLENKDCIDAQHKEYRENNKDNEKLRQQEYKRSSAGIVSRINSFHKHRANKKYNKDDNFGQITETQYLEMMEFFKGKCAYSGTLLHHDNATIDHIMPVSKYGENVIWNIVPCRRDINEIKSNKDFEKWFIGEKIYSKWRLKKIRKWQQYAENKWGK